jgi:hypothetical protein
LLLDGDSDGLSEGDSDDEGLNHAAFILNTAAPSVPPFVHTVSPPVVEFFFINVAPFLKPVSP